MIKLFDFVIPENLLLFLIFILFFNSSCKKENNETNQPSGNNITTQTYCIKAIDELSLAPLLNVSINATGINQAGYYLYYNGTSDSLGKYCFDQCCGEKLLGFSGSALNYISSCSNNNYVAGSGYEPILKLRPSSFIRFHIKNSQLNNQDEIYVDYRSSDCSGNRTLHIQGLLVDTTFIASSRDGNSMVTWTSWGSSSNYSDTLNISIAQPRDTASVEIIY